MSQKANSIGNADSIKKAMWQEISGNLTKSLEKYEEKIDNMDPSNAGDMSDFMDCLREVQLNAWVTNTDITMKHNLARMAITESK